MRAVTLQFGSFAEVAAEVEAGGDDQDLELPEGESGTDGEWVLAEFVVGDQLASIAACIVDRGYGLRLAFDDRDWQRLWQFANSAGPPSVPPLSSLPPPSGRVAAPPHTRILLVDGDRETLSVLQALLEEAGFLSTTARTAEEALARLREFAIDLVVLERSLPGTSGLELCRRIRADRTLATLPVLFLAAPGSASDLVTAFEAGGDDFVAKPFRAEELRVRLLGLLRRSRMEPHAARPA